MPFNCNLSSIKYSTFWFILIDGTLPYSVDCINIVINKLSIRKTRSFFERVKESIEMLSLLNSDR